MATFSAIDLALLSFQALCDIMYYGFWSLAGMRLDALGVAFLLALNIPPFL